MAADGELKKIRQDLQRNREEIAALQRRIQSLIEKRRGPSSKKASDSTPSNRKKE
jgi:hypothetical protein